MKPKLFSSSNVSSLEHRERDKQWMLQAQLGDRKAFESIYEEYKNSMLSYFSALISNRATAEELCQDVFLKVYRSRADFNPQSGSFKTWLWSIARNTGLDWLRKKRELLVDPQSADAHEAQETNLLDTLESSLPNAEEVLIEKAQEGVILDCLSRLPESQRQVLSLRLFSELDYTDLAQELQVSMQGVKSLLFRARSSVLDCLKRKLSHG